MHNSILLLSAALLAGCTVQPDLEPIQQTPAMFETAASDGVRIYGYPYYGEHSAEAPTILLFHQGGASARGEYPQIARWFNSLGYRAIAWDLRKGGEIFEVPNRTVQGLAPDAEAEFCTTYHDVEAALVYATSDLGLDKVVVVGSSYSGSLVYQLAARHPDRVQAVLAFSPASGGPVAECKADLWADQVRAPAMVLRPASEMERDSSQAQREVVVANGATFFIADPGTHGASMLLAERADGDVTETRRAVAAWLAENVTP